MATRGPSALATVLVFWSSMVLHHGASARSTQACNATARSVAVGIWHPKQGAKHERSAAVVTYCIDALIYCCGLFTALELTDYLACRVALLPALWLSRQ